MVYAGRFGLTLVFLIAFRLVAAQQFFVGSKTPLEAVLPVVIKTNHFNADLYAGFFWRDKRLFTAVDIAIARESPRYANYYSHYVDLNDYSQRSVSFGVMGRYYMLPGMVKVYLEPALYLNYVNIHEPIVIPHFYGAYVREISNQEWLWSAHLGIGVVLRFEQWEFGMHLQQGFIEPFSEFREAGHVRVASNQRFTNGRALYFSPLSLQYTFGKN